MPIPLYRFKEFLAEAVSPSIIEKIKEELVAVNGASDWGEFVDNQTLGDCQGIVSDVVRMGLSGVVRHFGEIQIDAPLDKEDFDKIMTHHWVSINGEVYEFSKGTLKDYVDFDDLYSPVDGGEVSYINEIKVK